MKQNALVLEDIGLESFNGFYCSQFGELISLGQVLLKKYSRADQVHFLINYGGSLSLEDTIKKSESPSIQETFFNEKLKTLIEKYNPKYIYIFKNNIWHEKDEALNSCIEYNAIENLFIRYKGVILLNKDILSNNTLPQKCQYSHILNLVNEAIENHKKYPTDKLHRWLGFTQGVLSVTGLIDVDTERDYTRPFLHSYHSSKIKSF